MVFYAKTRRIVVFGLEDHTVANCPLIYDLGLAQRMQASEILSRCKKHTSAGIRRDGVQNNRGSDALLRNADVMKGGLHGLLVPVTPLSGL